MTHLKEDLPFEDLLKISSKLYDKYSLTVLEKEVEKLIQQEKQQRIIEDKLTLQRNKQFNRDSRANRNYILNHLLPRLMTPKSFIVTTAFSLLVGICAYYYKSQYMSTGIS